MFEHPPGLPQIFIHSSGSAQATVSGNNILATIPGKTINHNGSNFKKEAKTHPALA